MRFLGHLRDDLDVERHAAFVSANLGQQPVIEPFSPSEPATGKIEGYARHENEVQLV
jgi:hypothetical protein